MQAVFKFSIYGKGAIRRIRDFAPNGKLGYPTSGDYTINLPPYKIEELTTKINSDPEIQKMKAAYCDAVTKRSEEFENLNTDQILRKCGYFEE